MANQLIKFFQIEVTAIELFEQYGIKRITLEELCNKSGVSKSTFYKHFSNKNELIQYLFSKLLRKKKNQFTNILSSKGTFNKRAKLLFQYTINESHPNKNMLIEEISRSYPEQYGLYKQQLQYQFESCLKFFAQAQDDKTINNHINSQIIVMLLQHFAVIMHSKEMKSIIPSAIKRSDQLFNIFYSGILV